MSDEKKSNGSKSGIGLCGAAFLVFLTLKLAEIGVVANWSWWWVTAPLWMPLALVIVILIIWLIVFVVKSSRRKKTFSDRLREVQNKRNNY